MGSPTQVISQEDGYSLEQAQVPDGSMMELRVPILSAPSVELAQAGLHEYGFDHRFSLVKMSQMGGGSPLWAYSLSEIEQNLKPVPLINFEMMQQGSFCYVDLPNLATWVEQTSGDQDLADAIREIAAQDRSFGKLAPFAKSLLQARLASYEQVLATQKADITSDWAGDRGEHTPLGAKAADSSSNSDD